MKISRRMGKAKRAYQPNPRRAGKQSASRCGCLSSIRGTALPAHS